MENKKKSCKNNKFKTLQRGMKKLPVELYFVSDIQDYFEYIM